jgi:hypothetical protein
MAIVAGALVVAVVLLVAVYALRRELARMAAHPPPQVFDVDDAVEWVARHVSDEFADGITVEGVRQIVELQVRFFAVKSASRNGSTAGARGPVVVGPSETVAWILGEAERDGVAYTAEQVRTVVDLQLSYLDAIGALGDRLPEPADPGDPGEPGEPGEPGDPAR